MVVGGWGLRQTCFLLGSSDFNTFCVAHLYNHTAFQRVRFPELLASLVLHISQTTHTAVKGRNIWFSFNCRAIKKQEATSPRQQQSLLKAVGPFFSTNGKADKCPCPNSQSCFHLVVLGRCCPEKLQTLSKRWHYRYRDIPYTQGLLLGAQLRPSRARGDHIPHHSKAASSHSCSVSMCWNKQFHTFPLVCQDIKKKNANVTGGNFLKPVEKVGVSNWLSGCYLQTVSCHEGSGT